MLLCVCGYKGDKVDINDHWYHQTAEGKDISEKKTSHSEASLIHNFYILFKNPFFQFLKSKLNKNENVSKCICYCGCFEDSG